MEKTDKYIQQVLIRTYSPPDIVRVTRSSHVRAEELDVNQLNHCMDVLMCARVRSERSTGSHVQLVACLFKFG